MLKALRRYEYAGVIVFRLDRLGRTASQLSLDIAELENKGLQVLSATEAYDTATAIGKAMRSIILIMAELERENNAEASVARRASAKLHGKHIGRHNSASQRQVRRVRQLRASGLGYSEIQKQTQLSYGTCFAIINFKGVYGPRLSERLFADGQQFSKVDEDKVSDSATLETASVT